MQGDYVDSENEILKMGILKEAGKKIFVRDDFFYHPEHMQITY